MYDDFSQSSKKVCEGCGMRIQNGDLVYDSGKIMLHDECFFDFIRMFVLDNGWRHYVYGDEEMD